MAECERAYSAHRSGCLDTMEALLAIVIFGIDTIEKQHVVVDIEI